MTAACRDQRRRVLRIPFRRHLASTASGSAGPHPPVADRQAPPAATGRRLDRSGGRPRREIIRITFAPSAGRSRTPVTRLKNAVAICADVTTYNSFPGGHPGKSPARARQPRSRQLGSIGGESRRPQRDDRIRPLFRFDSAHSPAVRAPRAGRPASRRSSPGVWSIDGKYSGLLTTRPRGRPGCGRLPANIRGS